MSKNVRWFPPKFKLALRERRSAHVLGRGCSLEFLSVYPKEREYLYPPLTYLQPEGTTITDDGITLVEVTPQMA